MRRMLAMVGMTFSYTLCAAVWKMVEQLNEDRSEAAVETFARLVHNYRVAVGSHFAYVVNFLKDQDPKLSYYLGNNGITNMVS